MPSNNDRRIVWLDWMRILACFMVMLVHSTEPFYLGGEGSLIATEGDAWWAAFFDSFVRSCVPLFVIASSYLQFPIHYSTGEFFRKRAVRILVPFAIWSVFYAFWWGGPADSLKGLLLNFNYASGHLWFVYMLLGLYLIMPLLSPWAEKVGRKELTLYLGIWGFTTLIPLIRDWASQTPLVLTYGPTGLPQSAKFPLWGEASWNQNGTFYYISGFIGYMLLGLWLRKFGDGIGLKKSILCGAVSFCAGFAITAGGFLRRVYECSGGTFPFEDGVAIATWWETTWDFTSTGVALMTFGIIMMMKNIHANGWIYQHIVLPVSKASYGMYLGHMVALSIYAGLFRGIISSTPLVIICTAISSYITMAFCAILIQRIPKVGRFIIG